MDIKQLLAKFNARRARPRDRRDEKGFTMAEVLLSIIVFTISVVGVVAMQRASIAAESSAAVLREGQRLGANEMEAMLSRSFNDLVEHDFNGNPMPAYPFDDLNLVRTFPYRGVPMDVDWSTIAPGNMPPGMQARKYRVVRRIDALPAGLAPGNPVDVQALQLQVWVLWLDYQPSNPIPESIGVEDLLPSMIDRNSPDYRDFVQGVHLATVRANDGKASEADTP